MKIRFVSAQISDRKINRKSDQKEFRFREQEAVVEVGQERRLIVVRLEIDQSAFPPGEYSVEDGSFYVDKNRNLQIGRLALKPIAINGASVADKRLAG